MPVLTPLAENPSKVIRCRFEHSHTPSSLSIVADLHWVSTFLFAVVFTPVSGSGAPSSLFLSTPVSETTAPHVVCLPIWAPSTERWPRGMDQL